MSASDEKVTNKSNKVGDVFRLKKPLTIPEGTATLKVEI
jgi:hypothetical protein